MLENTNEKNGVMKEDVGKGQGKDWSNGAECRDRQSKRPSERLNRWNLR